MDTVALLVVVAIAILAYLYFTGRLTGRPGAGRSRPGAAGSKGEPAAGAASAAGPEVDLSLDGLKPGDVLALWSGKEALVERVLTCRETLPGRVTHWRWAFLEGGQLLAVTPAGNTLYTDTVVLYQGTAPFEQLTGEVERGGVLKTFEARVQERTSGASPVYFDYDGQRYQVLSTGTFGVADEPVPDAEVWRDVQADESQNVYFRLAGPEGAQVLGIWTSHIALLTGRAVSPADVRAVYRVGR